MILACSTAVTACPSFSMDGAVREGVLVSYGIDREETLWLAGNYAARIQKGEKPESMPVQQSTKTKMVINLKTAFKPWLRLCLRRCSRAPTR